MGHCTLVQAPTGYTYYHWDAAGNMTLAEPPAGVVTFMHDAERRRVGKTSIDGSFTRFVYDAKRLLQESAADGSEELTYTAATDEPFGYLLNEYEAGSGTNLYYQYDAQASTEMLSDDAGNVLGPYAYQAFGLIANASMSGWADLTPDLWASMGPDDWGELPVGRQSNFGGNFAAFGQNGAYLDPETQLYLMGGSGGTGRYYDPVGGRFISEDRTGMAGGDANLFRYCGNDPVNKKDPGGAEPAGINHAYPLYLGGAPSQEYMIYLNETRHTAFHDSIRKYFRANHITDEKSDDARLFWASRPDAEREAVLRDAMKAADYDEKLIDKALPAVTKSAQKGVNRTEFRIESRLGQAAGDAETRLREEAATLKSAERQKLEYTVARANYEESVKNVEQATKRDLGFSEIAARQRGALNARRELLVAQMRAAGRTELGPGAAKIAAQTRTFDEILDRGDVLLRSVRVSSKVLTAVGGAFAAFGLAGQASASVSAFTKPNTKEGDFYNRAVDVLTRLQNGENVNATEVSSVTSTKQGYLSPAIDSFLQEYANALIARPDAPLGVADNVKEELSKRMQATATGFSKSADELRAAIHEVGVGLKELGPEPLGEQADVDIQGAVEGGTAALHAIKSAVGDAFSEAQVIAGGAFEGIHNEAAALAEQQRLAAEENARRARERDLQRWKGGIVYTDSQGRTRWRPSATVIDVHDPMPKWQPFDKPGHWEHDELDPYRERWAYVFEEPNPKFPETAIGREYPSR